MSNSSNNNETLAPVGQAADESSCNHGILVCESCGSTYCERCALHIEKIWAHIERLPQMLQGKIVTRWNDTRIKYDLTDDWLLSLLYYLLGFCDGAIVTLVVAIILLRRLESRIKTLESTTKLIRGRVG